MTEPAELTVATITITRCLDSDGSDLVYVESEDTNGDRLPVVEALGLLSLASWEVLNHEDDDDG